MHLLIKDSRGRSGLVNLSRWKNEIAATARFKELKIGDKFELSNGEVVLAEVPMFLFESFAERRLIPLGMMHGYIAFWEPAAAGNAPHELVDLLEGEPK